MKMRIMAWLFLALPVFGQATHVRSIDYIEWYQESVVERVVVKAEAGDWLEVAIACDTGEYLKFCGIPEIEFDGFLRKLACHNAWTSEPTTMQTCGLVVPASGELTLWFPVIQSGIEYSASYAVIEGP